MTKCVSCRFDGSGDRERVCPGGSQGREGESAAASETNECASSRRSWCLASPNVGMRDASSVNEDSSSDGAMRTGHLSTDFDLVDFEKAVRLRPKAGAAPRAAIGRALGSVASRLKAKNDAATSMVLTESRIPNSGQGAGAPLQPPAVHDGLVAADGPLQAETSSSAPIVSAQLKRKPANDASVRPSLASRRTQLVISKPEEISAVTRVLQGVVAPGGTRRKGSARL